MSGHHEAKPYQPCCGLERSPAPTEEASAAAAAAADEVVAVVETEADARVMEQYESQQEHDEDEEGEEGEEEHEYEGGVAVPITRMRLLRLTGRWCQWAAARRVASRTWHRARSRCRSKARSTSSRIQPRTLLLHLVWDEVGEREEDRDKVLFQLDQECLDVYKRKVDQAIKSRDLLLQALDYSKMELARLASALGEKSIARTNSHMRSAWSGSVCPAMSARSSSMGSSMRECG
ncbi:hypothetical protein ABZP36_014979 [Zizania latifolia]